jgi:hypothetical protein
MSKWRFSMRLRKRAIMLASVALLSVTAVVGATAAIAAATQTTTLDSAFAHVPAGQVLEVKLSNANGQLLARYVLDPEKQRGEQEVPIDDLGSNIVLFDENGHSTLSAYDLEICEAGAGYSDIAPMTDGLAGKSAARVGDDVANGSPVTIFRAQVMDDQGHAVGVTAYVDSVTGLRTKEVWGAGSEQQTIERRLTTRTSAVESALNRESLMKIAEVMKSDRLKTLASLTYDVCGLAEGWQGLHLRNVIPGTDWNSVRLEYSCGVSILPAVTIESWNLKARPDYPARLCSPLTKASPQQGDGGERLCYKTGSVAVQIVTTADRSPCSAIEIAAAVHTGEAGK